MPKKRAIQKNTDSAKKTKKIEAPAPDQAQEAGRENAFGGIPDRNLKKSLGC
jgi:hypothetical protein